VLDEFARAADLIRLWPRWLTADPALARRPHRLGTPVRATADMLYHDISPEHPRDDLAELVALGLAGIVTNLLELLRDVLAAGTS
jgi:hypothetical protein